MVNNKSMIESLIDGKTDHETLLLVRQDIANLKESQAAFHKEVRQSFEDLKNNYSSTLANHENRIVGLESTKADFREKLKVMDQKIKDGNVYTILLCGIGVLLIGIVLWHVFGYHT